MPHLEREANHWDKRYDPDDDKKNSGAAENSGNCLQTLNEIAENAPGKRPTENGHPQKEEERCAQTMGH
jgi:hypothetical protein